MGRYDYDDFGFGGYEGQRRDTEVVSFYRPDGKCEGKDIGWCLDNGFFEIEDGLWSGDWYYEHHPNYKSEQEAACKEKAAKRKRISPDDSRKRAKEARRAELLDEIYNGAYHPRSHVYDSARRELDILDGKEVSDVVMTAKKPRLFKQRKTAHVPKGEFSCPVCKKHFVTEDLQKEHVQTQGGKGHRRYRRQPHLWSNLPPPYSNRESKEPCHALFQEQMDQGQRRFPPAPQQDHQQSATSLTQEHVPPTNQTDIRSFFQDAKPLSDIPNKQSDIRSFFKPKSNNK